MFDMNKSVDRRQAVLTLGMILFFASMPAFLILVTQLDGDLLPSILIGVALYIIFSRKSNQKEKVKNA